MVSLKLLEKIMSKSCISEIYFQLCGNFQDFFQKKVGKYGQLGPSPHGSTGPLSTAQIMRCAARGASSSSSRMATDGGEFGIQNYSL